MSFLFRDQSWLHLQEYLKKRTLLILPVGTTEEHGPHLPVDTDARIAEAYGTRLAATLVSEIPVLLLDTIRHGYSIWKLTKRFRKPPGPNQGFIVLTLWISCIVMYGVGANRRGSLRPIIGWPVLVSTTVLAANRWGGGSPESGRGFMADRSTSRQGRL